MVVNQFKVILNIETNLIQDEVATLLNKLSEFVHEIYKADEKSDMVSLDIDINHISLTGQQNEISEIANFPDLIDWLTSITRYDDFDKFIKVETLSKSDSIRVEFWTEKNVYAVSARLPGDNDNGYLGCIVSARKPRTGEDWTRGNDLPDGSYCKKTWRKIVKAILAYEDEVNEVVLIGVEQIFQEHEETTVEITANE